MSKQARKHSSGLVVKILGVSFVVASLLFGVSMLNNSNPGKTAQAAALSNTDLSNLAVNCTSVKSSAGTTTCIFDLPPGFSSPSNLVLGVGDAVPAGVCTPVNALVTCTNVPIGTKTRIQSVFAKIGTGSAVDTGDQIYIQPANSKISTGKFLFGPDKGSSSPLFRSTDVVTVTLKNFKTDTDPNPTSGAYTCQIFVRAFNPKSASAAWTPIGSGLAYDPVNGCTTQFTKAIRGSGLNWSIKATVSSTTDATLSYDLYEQFVYRFQGSGIASGG
jgi:hypothetical protein